MILRGTSQAVMAACRAMKRIFAGILALVTVLWTLSVPLPVSAQSSDETGIVQITVRDAEIKAPLRDARVFLLGPTVASALTTRSGIVKYTDVPAGLYRVRVGKSGFTGASSAQFEVLGNKEVDVEVSLASTASTISSSSGGSDGGLRIIGKVSTKVALSSHDVYDDSPIRKITDSLTDALNTLAGVDVTQASNDPDAAQTISLHGMDESQTGVTLDGIPLGAAGSAVNLRSLNTDLFSGASTSFGPQAGALAGTVNFRTLQPTQTWQSLFSASDGSFDRFNYQLGETGSIGKLGIAVLHTERRSNNPLTFQTYEDASGLTYAHQGESENEGDFLKLRYALDDRTTLNLTGLQNHQAIATLCTQWVTILPCGIGPGNGTTGRFQFAYASITSLIGDVGVAATAYVNSNASFTNDIDRFINSVAEPFSSDQDTLARGFALSSTIARGKHTLTLSGSTYASTTSFTPIDTTGLSSYVLPSRSSVASRSAQLSDAIKASDRLQLGPNISFADTTGAGPSILAGITAGLRPNSTDNYSLGLSVGSSQPAAGLVRTWSDPDSARVNCYAQTATVSGPGDQNGPQSALNYQGSFSHQAGAIALSGDLYRQVQRGQLVNATLSTDAAGLPAGYLSAVDAYYTLPTVCGTSFGAPTLYVNEQIGDTARVYQGFDLTGRFGLGRNVVAIANYTTSSAVLSSADALLQGGSSTTILGSQLPGRPLHKANLTLDVNEPHSGIEFLANTSVVGPGNAQNISPYALVNVGLSRQFGIGRLTVFESNVFNTETGLFSTLLYAQPLALSGGGTLLAAANPNPPRAITVTYAINTAARRGAGGAGAARKPAALVSGASPAPSASASPDGGNRLRGQFRFEPPPTGVDPLSPAASRDACTPDDLARAQVVLTQIQAAANAYAAGAPFPTNPNLTIIGHGDRTTTTWYLEIRPAFGGARPGSAGPSAAGAGASSGPRPGGFGGPGGYGGPSVGPPPTGPIVVGPSSVAPQPRRSPSPENRARFETIRSFVSCAYITALKPADAKAKGIAAQGPGFGYTPSIGLFFLQPADLGSGGGSVKQ